MACVKLKIINKVLEKKPNRTNKNDNNNNNSNSNNNNNNNNNK